MGTRAIIHSDWGDVAAFVQPWPLSRRAVWQDAAADDAWIRAAAARAQLALLTELELRLSRIDQMVRDARLD
jgi:hypothetical protein